MSNVSQVERLSGDVVLFRNESYLEPPAWYRYDAKTAKSTKTALAKSTVADMSDAEVVRETCVSKDGTKVPLNVIRVKGTKYDGKNVALLTGYGGYGMNISPRFREKNRFWLESGGHRRRSEPARWREFGEEWHLSGNLTHKQNVFDDFPACAKRLLDERATRPERLAIRGGSERRAADGRELVQHPEMFAPSCRSSGSTTCCAWSARRTARST